MRKRVRTREPGQTLPCSVAPTVGPRFGLVLKSECGCTSFKRPLPTIMILCQVSSTVSFVDTIWGLPSGTRNLGFSTEVVSSGWPHHMLPLCELKATIWSDVADILVTHAVSLQSHDLISCHLCFSFSISAASFGKLGYRGGDCRSRQGCGVPETDISGAHARCSRSSFCTSGEAPGKWGLVHLSHICMWFVQRLLSQSFKCCQGRNSTVRDYFLVFGIIGDSQLEFTECFAALSVSYWAARIDDAFSCSFIY